MILVVPSNLVFADSMIAPLSPPPELQPHIPAINTLQAGERAAAASALLLDC